MGQADIQTVVMGQSVRSLVPFRSNQFPQSLNYKGHANHMDLAKWFCNGGSSCSWVQCGTRRQTLGCTCPSLGPNSWPPASSYPRLLTLGLLNKLNIPVEVMASHALESPPCISTQKPRQHWPRSWEAEFLSWLHCLCWVTLDKSFNISESQEHHWKWGV